MKNRKAYVASLLATVCMMLMLVTSAAASNNIDPLENTLYFAKRVVYALWSYEDARSGIDYLIDHLGEFLVLNPNPDGRDIKPYLGFFMSILWPLYTLAIATTGFYLIFISGSPKGRSKAKSLISTLVIGMIITAMSPVILKFFMEASSTATRMVLDRTGTKTVSGNLESVFGRPGSLTQNTQNVIPTTPISQLHFFVTFIEVELGYYTFLPVLLVVWGTLILFSIRFIALTLFIILFPLAVFFYSFHTTKDVGRNMLEEMISWTLIQVFNGFVAAAITLVLLQRPPGSMQISSGIGVPLMVTSLDLSLVVFDMIPFIGCFVIGVAPIFILRLFRNFLP